MIRCRCGATSLHIPLSCAHPPSEGEAISRISRSPSKVSRCITASGTPCSCVFPSAVPDPPSEGETISRVFRPPSESAWMHRRLQNPLWPRFPLIFRRCVDAALPPEPCVAAFSLPPYQTHLPKVGTTWLALPRFSRAAENPLLWKESSRGGISSLLRKESVAFFRGNVACSIPGGHSENPLLWKESTRGGIPSLLRKESGEGRSHNPRSPRLTCR